MIFRQLFDSTSSTYTYLLASRHGGEALIIDPVIERVDRYVQLLKELDLRLVKAIDTHLHADHITGLEALRERTDCITVMGEQTKADVVSIRVTDDDRIDIEGLSLDVAYTPGHTDDSYSFLMPDRVFTGDTLLIRGTGRTDFQNGDPRAQYESLFGRLLKLPDETMVYPAHDYKGDMVSTIGEERAFNPRLQVKSVDDYVALMSSPQFAQRQDDGRCGARQYAQRPCPEDRRRSRLGPDRGRCEGLAERQGCCPDRLAGTAGAAARRHHPRLPACDLPQRPGEPASGRSLAAACALFRQAPNLLLLL